MNRKSYKKIIEQQKIIITELQNRANLYNKQLEQEIDYLRILQKRLKEINNE